MSLSSTHLSQIMNHCWKQLSIDHGLHLLLISSSDIRKKPNCFLKIKRTEWETNALSSLLTLFSFSRLCWNNFGKWYKAPQLRTNWVWSSVPVTTFPTALNAKRNRWRREKRNASSDSLAPAVTILISLWFNNWTIFGITPASTMTWTKRWSINLRSASRKRLLLGSYYFHNREDKPMPMYNRPESSKEMKKKTVVPLTMNPFDGPWYQCRRSNSSEREESLAQLEELTEALYVDRDWPRPKWYCEEM